MMGVEFHRHPARRFPLEVEAQRLVLGAVFRQRAAVRQILAAIEGVGPRHARGGTEMFGIEDRTRDRAIGPRARRIFMVEPHADRSEEHTSELQSLMRTSYAVFCLKKKKPNTSQT